MVKPSYDDQENFTNPSKGFIAGNSLDMRLTTDKNKIPVFNYDRARYERTKGNDFE